MIKQTYVRQDTFQQSKKSETLLTAILVILTTLTLAMFIRLNWLE